MKKIMLVAVMAVTMSSNVVFAKGCLKGAAVGAVAGKVAGNHTIKGAIAGCVVGRYLANRQKIKTKK